MTEKWRHFLCIRKSLNGWCRRSVQLAQAEPDQNIFIRYNQNHADSSIPTTLLFKSSRKSSHLTLNINQFQDDLVSAEPMLPLHYYIQRNPCKTSSFAFPVSRSNHPINITLFKLNNSGKHWSQLKDEGAGQSPSYHNGTNLHLFYLVLFVDSSHSHLDNRLYLNKYVKYSH